MYCPTVLIFLFSLMETNMCAVLMQTYSVRELSSKRLLQCNHASDFWKCVVETKPSFGSVACLHEAQTWK